MKSRRFSRIGGLVAASLLVSLSTGCNTDTDASLINLTATTSGSLVQILLTQVLTDAQAQNHPDLTVPLVDQKH